MSEHITGYFEVLTTEITPKVSVVSWITEESVKTFVLCWPLNTVQEFQGCIWKLSSLFPIFIVIRLVRCNRWPQQFFRQWMLLLLLSATHCWSEFKLNKGFPIFFFQIITTSSNMTLNYGLPNFLLYLKMSANFDKYCYKRETLSSGGTVTGLFWLWN